MRHLRRPPGLGQQGFGRDLPMNGLHDMGGMHGFGRVEVDADEPVFHPPGRRACSESCGACRAEISTPAGTRSSGSTPSATSRTATTGAGSRRSSPRSSSLGALRPDEVEARMRNPRPADPRARGSARLVSVAGPGLRPAGRPRRRSATASSCARATTSPSDTRGCPPMRAAGAARSPTGMRRWSTPTTTRTGAARIRSTSTPCVSTGNELWGDAAEPGTVVLLDLFEPYLEPA